MKVYSASREGHLPEVISYVNKFTLTPLPGLLFNGLLGIVFVLLNDINALLNMYMVAASFFYGLCMLALLVLRYTRRDVERTFKVTILLPLFKTLTLSIPSQVWIVVPLFIMLFFWYCTIAPLTEIPSPDCPTNATETTTTEGTTTPSEEVVVESSDCSVPAVGNIDMVRGH